MPPLRLRDLTPVKVVAAMLLAAIICAGLAYMVDSRPGLYGAAIGGLFAISFLWLGTAILGVLHRASPGLLMAVALLTYCLQVVALLGLYAVFANSPSWASVVSSTAFGATVIACSLVWTVGLVLASRRTRTPVYDLEDAVR